MYYTKHQVIEQKQRFELFLIQANLQKIAARYCSLHNEGVCREYIYIRRVLKLANVEPAMYVPGSNLFYRDILINCCLNAYILTNKTY